MLVVITALTAMLAVGIAHAEERTAAQMAVLEVVQAYSEASHQRDLERYLGFWHEDFLGWHNGDDQLTNKEQRRRGLQRYFEATKSIEFEIEPLAIRVIADGNAAIVHYVLRNTLENPKSGERVEGVSYWTDYLVRENGRWWLYGDHGGSVSR